MQFNAVVANNTHALHLYERIGFTRLGVIPQGFRMPDDIMDKYKELVFSLLIFIFSIFYLRHLFYYILTIPP